MSFDMGSDNFKILANHYDSMMSHIDYERWLTVSAMIAELCPDENFEHLDVGCGTGTLVKLFREFGWRTYGVDLSRAMVKAASRNNTSAPVFQANMIDLPFSNSFHFVTCVFDSLNFLLEKSNFHKALKSMHGSMTDQGILYFDVITERMVLEYYADRDWVDREGEHDTRWHGVYHVDDRIIENTIWINEGEPSIVRERVYSIEEIHEAVEKAGLSLLGIVDTETWCAPTEDTLRMDIIASAQHSEEVERKYRHIQQDIQILLDERY